MKQVEHVSSSGLILCDAHCVSCQQVVTYCLKVPHMDAQQSLKQSTGLKSSVFAEYSMGNTECSRHSQSFFLLVYRCSMALGI